MIYRRIVRPVLFRQDPERSHERVLSLLERTQRIPALTRLISSLCVYEDSRLKVDCWGLRFSNPVGLAAGFDKDARLVQIMPALGFGFIEIGTVTPNAQPGNPRPRISRLPHDRALINRLGFNSAGADAVAARLQKWGKPSAPLGVNIGKNRNTHVDAAMQDYLYSFEKLFPYADYFAINVSSPNTPELRQLQNRERLQELLKALAQLDQKLALNLNQLMRPILVKIAPDLSFEQLDDILTVSQDLGIAGIIATNTTVMRERLRTPSLVVEEAGGLSGAPLAPRSNEIISYVYRHTDGKLPIIGVGGIFCAEDAYAKLKAGASLIQVYTGFIYEGPMMVKRINRALARILTRTGANHISELTGISSE